MIKLIRASFKLDNVTTTPGFNQLINKLTHFVNDTSSCIDSLFSSDKSLVKNCGIEQSIYGKCRFNIIFGTLNFSIPLLPLGLEK